MDIGDDLSAGDLLDEQGRAFEGVDDVVGVGAPLETEAGVGAELVASGRLADGDGVEPRALDEHAFGGVGDSALYTTKDAGDAERLIGVANHEVVGAEFPLLAVEGHEWRTFGAIADDDCLSVDFVGVEGVERLTDAEEDVVGDVDDVVYGVEADGFKGFLEPLRRILDGHALDEDAAVARAGLWILDVDFYAGPVVVGGESVDRWA